MARKPNTPTHDWEALKQDYLASEIMDVQDWGRKRFGHKKATRSGNFGLQTHGWKDEKIKLREEQTRLTVEKLKQKGSDQMAEALDNIYGALVRQTNRKDLDTWSPKTIKSLWEMIMVANGLPTNTTKNQNDNFDRTKEQESLALKDLTQKAQNANNRKKKK